MNKRSFAIGAFACSIAMGACDASGLFLEQSREGGIDALAVIDEDAREAREACIAKGYGALGADSRIFGSSGPSWQELYARQNESNLRDPLGGWNILSDYYRADTRVNRAMDGLSIEWDYYSIHDRNGNFTGIVGYLLCDPEGRLGGDDPAMPGLALMPSGANLAVNGMFAGGRKSADYVRIGGRFDASAERRTWYASDGASWGRETPIEENADGVPEMRLEGLTPNYAWDLRVTQAWPERDGLPLRRKKWEVGNDLNPLRVGLEHWTVNMIWPTTLVRGTITDRVTGITYPIDGHGYRENSFGRWAFCFGGWDFYFMSDMDRKIQIGFQTYHFDTGNLDFMDADFIDPATGAPVAIRFSANDGELGWAHDRWRWDGAARQCVPEDARIIARKDGYAVEVRVDIGDNYIPILSSATPLTASFVINCLFPRFSGSITRANGEVLYTFEGIQGGGEFALPRSIVGRCMYLGSRVLIDRAFSRVFANPFPE
jgi:hypothetical protein